MNANILRYKDKSTASMVQLLLNMQEALGSRVWVYPEPHLESYLGCSWCLQSCMLGLPGSRMVADRQRLSGPDLFIICQALA